MAKRSGSKGTRSERKAERQRSLRARERGLPERREAPLRARVSMPGSVGGEARSSDAPRSVAGARSAGIPPIAKVVAGALVILVAGYVLSRFRDQPSVETSTIPEQAPSDSAATSPEPEPAALPEPARSAPRESAPSPLVAPAKPLVPAPVVTATPKPQVPVPKPPAAAAPAAPKPPAAVAPVAPKPPVVSPPADNPH